MAKQNRRISVGIANIVDHRKHKYRFVKINAVVEPTCHDNSLADSDQVEWNYKGIGYDEIEHVTLADALAWAQSFMHPVTLFIYDHDGGIYVVREDRVQAATI
jgi:hypothetical protein